MGRLCEKCEGKCVICDSYVRPHTLVRLCNECDFGSFAGRCTVCGAPGIADAYYCKECVQQEKDVRVCAPSIPHVVEGCAPRPLSHSRAPPYPSPAAARRLPQSAQHWGGKGRRLLHGEKVRRKGEMRGGEKPRCCRFFSGDCAAARF